MRSRARTPTSNPRASGAPRASPSTPAIGDAEAFLKMMSLAKRWCYFARPVRRTDEVLFEARRRCGLPESRDPFDTDFLSAFSLAWLRGYTPEIRRYHDVWNTDRRR